MKGKYVIVLHPDTFVLDTKYANKTIVGKEWTKLGRYLYASKSEILRDYVHIYRYRHRKTAIKRIVDRSYLKDEKYDLDSIEPGYYVVRQDEALIAVEADWQNDIVPFQGLDACTVLKYNEDVYSYIKSHLYYYMEPKYYTGEYMVDESWYFTYGSYDGFLGRLGYGVYVHNDRIKDIKGSDLTKIVSMAEDAGISDECMETLRNASVNFEQKYKKEKSEAAELLAVMHAVLVAKAADQKKMIIVYKNEKVMKYLTGEYSGEKLIKEDFRNDDGYESFNRIYFLFFKEVEKWDLEVRFVHVYRQVIFTDSDNTSANDKTMISDDIPRFEPQSLFEGSNKADELAKVSIYGDEDEGAGLFDFGIDYSSTEYEEEYLPDIPMVDDMYKGAGIINDYIKKRVKDGFVISNESFDTRVTTCRIIDINQNDKTVSLLFKVYIYEWPEHFTDGMDSVDTFEEEVKMSLDTGDIIR